MYTTTIVHRKKKRGSNATERTQLFEFITSAPKRSTTHFLIPNFSKTPPSFAFMVISLGVEEAKMAERDAHTTSSLCAASTGDHIPILSVTYNIWSTSSFVIFYYGGCHIMVTLQSLLESFWVIIAALNERFSSDIVFHGDFGRVIREMIGTSRCKMD
jgi:hypothetical protein